MRCSHSLQLITLIAFALTSSVALAEDAGSIAPPLVSESPTELQDQAAPGTPEARPDDEVHLNLIDQKLALSLAVDTRAQISLAEFALKNVSDEALRQLLEQRIAGQRAFSEKLESLTEGRTRSAIAQAMREIEQDRAADKAKPKKFALLSASKNATGMIVRIRVEQLAEYLGSVRGELEARRGEQFDRRFLQSDMLHQLQMIAMLKVFEGQASSDFAEVIRDANTQASAQLNQAKDLLHRLESAPPAAVVAAQPVAK
jgi:hypothetical protein